MTLPIPSEPSPSGPLISGPLISGPLISVIVPSRAVPPQFDNLLAGLAAQAIRPDAFELIVVTGGDPAAVTARVALMQGPLGLGFPVRVLAAPGPGPARKRNAGAAAALGDLLVFQDDDMAPEPSLLAAHLAAHGTSPNRVVMGYLPPEFAAGPPISWWAAQIRAWWDDTFADMAAPGHRFRYTDMLSGNFSIRAALFRQLGGFDPAYFPFDDYEFGVRLLAADVELAFCPAARSRHVDYAVLLRSMDRIETEGRLSIELVRRYPHLGGALPHWQLARDGSLPMRAVAELAHRRPEEATRLSRRMAAAADTAEQLRVYPAWFHAAGLAMALRYWVGVWRAATSWADVDMLAGRTGQAEPDGPSSLHGPGRTGQAEPNGAPSPHGPIGGEMLALDLAQGLPAAMAALDTCRPAGAVITWRGAPIGQLPPDPGAEPLRGRHLRAWVECPGAQAVAAKLAAEPPTGGVRNLLPPGGVKT